MAKPTVTTIVTHAIILMSATMVAFASVRAAETTWDILAETLDMFSLPPILDGIAVMSLLMLCVLLPLAYILGSAFVVAFFSLTLLRRGRLFEQDNTTAGLAVIGMRLVVASVYAGLSLSILVGYVLAWRCCGLQLPVP